MLALFAAATVVFGPAQLLVFARLRGGLAFHSMGEILLSRAGQVAVLALGMAATNKPEWYLRRRTELLTAGSAPLWALQLQSNNVLLALSVNDPFSQAWVAFCLSMALVMHLALPLKHGNLLPEIILRGATVVVQTLCAPLPPDEGRQFGAILALCVTLTTFIAVLLSFSAFTARPPSSEQTPNRHVEMSGKCLESRLDSVVEQQAEHEARLEALERCQEPAAAQPTPAQPATAQPATAQSATQLLQEQQSASLDQRLEHLVAMAGRLDARAAALDQREAEMDEEVDSETDDVEAMVPMFRVRAPVVPQVRSSNLPPVQGVPVAVVEEAAAEEVEQAGQEQDVNEATGERLGGSD